MALTRNCLKETFNIVLFLTIYLIFEVFILASVLVTSAILTKWVTRFGLYIYYKLDKNPNAVDHKLFELARAVIVSWLIFVITLQWTKYWPPQRLTILAKLQEFQRKSYALLCTLLMSILVPILILLCTCCQICSYFTKFYQKQPEMRKIKREVQYEPDDGIIMNHYFDKSDWAFLGSMWLLGYLSIMVFRFYRHVEMSKVVRAVGWEQAQCPTWRSYFECFGMAFVYEIFLSYVCIIIYLGFGTIYEKDSQLFSWFSYVSTCVIAVAFGVIIGDVEVRVAWLKYRNKLGFQTYFRMIQWDAHCYLLCLIFIPLLSFSYFRLDCKDDVEYRLLHNLLHMMFVANIWMCTGKGLKLFSYFIRGNDWNHRNDRIGMDFPFNVAINETAGGGQQGSVSTATGASLLERQTIIRNVETVAEAPQSHESEGLPAPPPLPPLENPSTPSASGKGQDPENGCKC